MRSRIAAVDAVAHAPGSLSSSTTEPDQRPFPQHRPGRVEVNDVDVRLGDPLEIIYQPEIVDLSTPLQ